ncbi:MAG: NAD(+) diphosphatase [Caldilineaceae bacterium]|nr:NAD(+) diphosphatase [Caldilineaceae bacterium]
MSFINQSPEQAAEFVPGVRAPAENAAPAMWFLFRGDELVIANANQSPLLVSLDHGEIANMAPLRQHYLGRLQTDSGTVHCFCGELDAGRVLPEGYGGIGLRQYLASAGATMAQLAIRARQVVYWDRDHQYCGRCGTPTELLPDERVRSCPQCGLSNYPRLSPAIIIAVTRRFAAETRILLARNHRFPAGRYSVIAGFVEPGETLEECAHREVLEEVGIQIRNIRYFGSQPWPFPHSLMIGFTAEYAGGEFVLEEGEIADAQWFAAGELPLVPPKISIARQLIDAFVTQNGHGSSIREW